MGKPIDGARKQAEERATEEAARLDCSHLFGWGGEYVCCRDFPTDWTFLLSRGWQIESSHIYIERCTRKDEQECPRLIRPRPAKTTRAPTNKPC